MTGTLVNAGAIVVGGFAGVLLKRGLSEETGRTCNQMFGLATAVVGLNGLLSNMMEVGADGRLSASGELLLFLSLVIGGVVGEALHLEERINRGGKRIEARLGSEGFAAGFINASLIFCVGAMAIMGAINDGLTGDSSVLFVKSALDGVFSAVPVFLYQGAITLLAGALAPYCTDAMLRSLCTVGYALVICIGLNFLLVNRIKTANLLPSLLVPIVYQLAVQYWI